MTLERHGDMTVSALVARLRSLADLASARLDSDVVLPGAGSSATPKSALGR
jgi:hypothetical protein